jgi:hypothetical protein
MYQSNMRARKYLVEVMGADHVYFQRHTKRKYKFYTKDGSFYTGTDFFNLWDGLCFIGGRVCFFQVKTNAFPNAGDVNSFVADKSGCNFLAINVKTKPQTHIETRWYT